MKTNPLTKAFTNAGIIISLLITTIFQVGFAKEENYEVLTTSTKQLEIEKLYVQEETKLENFKEEASNTLLKAEEKIKEEEAKLKEEEALRLKEEEEKKSMIVYDGLTMDELANKLERSLNDSLEGQGYLFAEYSLSLGIDPYLAVAITLHETGCKWQCSTLVKQCNNVGGMKGSPGCNGGSYKAFNSLSEGIKSYLDNLYNNYYSVGLTTPEQIGPKYAASQTWSQQVNSYINQIRAS